MSVAWGIGTTLGPLIGGVFAMPCDRWHSLAGCGPGDVFYERWEVGSENFQRGIRYEGVGMGGVSAFSTTLSSAWGGVFYTYLTAQVLKSHCSDQAG